jgi:hypothetical protein
MRNRVEVRLTALRHMMVGTSGGWASEYRCALKRRALLGQRRVRRLRRAIS